MYRESKAFEGGYAQYVNSVRLSKLWVFTYANTGSLFFFYKNHPNRLTTFE